MTPNYCGNYPVLGRSADDSVVDNFFSLAANLYFWAQRRQRKIRKIFKICVTSVTRQQMSLRVAMNEPSVGAND